MHTWRPGQSIRFLAIGLAWRQGGLLATEVYDDAGVLKGVRPLGGGVEFGEKWQDALIREFQEELGVRVKISGPAHFLENIYSHEGEIGHELVVAAQIALPADPTFDQDVIYFEEDNGQTCIAKWFEPKYLEQRGIPLFPNGLMKHVTKS